MTKLQRSLVLHYCKASNRLSYLLFRPTSIMHWAVLPKDCRRLLCIQIEILLRIFLGFFHWSQVWITGNCQDINMTLNVCSSIEQGNTRLVYDYRRAAAAIEMAVEYSNQVILPAGVKLKFHHKDGGTVCATNNLAIKNALDWMKEEVNCHVYIGPGKLNHGYTY